VKRIILPVCIVFCLGIAAFAQETPPDDGAKEPFNFKDLLPGLSLGVEFGAHEYPLEVWYPGQSKEGYSIRSLYITPNVVYNHPVEQFDFSFELDTTGDINAPDPSPGAKALNAKDADRKHWLSVYFEQGIAYRFPLDIPGTISVFLKNQNHFYLFPDFPVSPGVRTTTGKKADGVVKPGFAFSQEFPIGVVYTSISLPVAYLSRYSNDVGFGMEFMAGYKKELPGMTIGFDVTPKISFLPEVKYAATEFVLSYSWLDFSLELDITAHEAFKPITITPELQYVCFDGRWTYTLGCEIDAIREKRTFSPYIGFSYNF
jgi:hypothetical protein